jgi:ergothioneine biosynthesis protein EgtB
VPGDRISSRIGAPSHSPLAPSTDRRDYSLVDQYRAVRARTERLAWPLSHEDQAVQSMPDASPTKWHRAHTTWFFETFVLMPHLSGYRLFDAAFAFIFNSYYDAVGPRHPRARRGLLTRPTASAVGAYRAHVDAAMERLLEAETEELRNLVVLGLNHEQQHQELLLTDIKHAFAQSPLFPAYAPTARQMEPAAPLAPAGWWRLPGGVHIIGHDGMAFAFDNEAPAHGILLYGASIADRPVSNGEFRQFIEDRGYHRPELWLSDGWSCKADAGWEAPGYWCRDGRAWRVFTLHGLQPVRDDEPVCHVSFYEAAAYAEWAGARLPSEGEWEVAARRNAIAAAVEIDPAFHPVRLRQGCWQEVWEWTSSPYTAYPGYRPEAGALGEYNGKFMVNQMVLRGRSFATPPGHERLTYRNFFPPAARWQFSGLRLARNG